MKDFKNKVAAITGAASGMGRTLALELARRGCHLALSDVNEAGLAETAALYRYVKPLVDESGTILIREGRHPVVEQLSSDLTFVPNDTVLDCDGHRLVILTGPNMAGKSTMLRALGLVVAFAHLGLSVPATSATVPTTQCG